MARAHQTETDEDLGLIPGEEAFSTAADRVAAAVSGGARPSERDLLQLYGLYKQATTGDCDTPMPWPWMFGKLQQWCAVATGKSGCALPVYARLCRRRRSWACDGGTQLCTGLRRGSDGAQSSPTFLEPPPPLRTGGRGSGATA